LHVFKAGIFLDLCTLADITGKYTVISKNSRPLWPLVGSVGCAMHVVVRRLRNDYCMPSGLDDKSAHSVTQYKSTPASFRERSHVLLTASSRFKI